MIAESVAFLVASGKRVIYDAEHFFDGYRDDPTYAIECLRAALEAGAENLTMCDTNGASLPHQIAEAVHVVRRALPDAALGIHTHNDAECAVANSLAGDRRGRRDGPGHDERLRRALRQREPDLDHPEPAAEDGLRVPAVAGGADRGVAPGRRDAQPAAGRQPGLRGQERVRAQGRDARRGRQRRPARRSSTSTRPRSATRARCSCPSSRARAR